MLIPWSYDDLAEAFHDSLASEEFQIYSNDDHLMIEHDDQPLAQVLLDDTHMSAVITYTTLCPPSYAAYLALQLNEVIAMDVDLENAFVAQVLALVPPPDGSVH